MEELDLRLNFDLNVKKYENQNDLYKLIPTIIKNIGARRNFSIDDRNINDSNREYYFESYFILYKKVLDYYNRKSAGNKGRKKKHVSSIVLKEIRNQYVHGIITIDEAVKKSGLGSKETFYRRLRELNDKEE